MANIFRDGMYGLIAGDALGVPVEFSEREERAEDPVMGMRAYGTYNMPAGTWSDDSSMALATLSSLGEKMSVDFRDIMERFRLWYRHGDYTPFGKMFDIGRTTEKAIKSYEKGVDSLECGGTSDRDNGNGSLMRILPVCLYMYQKQVAEGISDDECIQIVHNVSAITHAHLRSKMACGFYYFCVRAILQQEGQLLDRLQAGINAGLVFYRQDGNNKDELIHFDRLIDLQVFKTLPADLIKSSGYVIDSIEAAVWCLITTESLEEALLKAVNLGKDTDTVGAITGGLAGLYYGFDDIPSEWIIAIQNKDEIDEYLNVF